VVIVSDKTASFGGFADTSIYGSEALTARSYGKALFELAQVDKRIVCLGADLTQPTETGLMRDNAADRFVMLGIAEANMIGVAAGMARCGDIPFTHTFCVFATRRCYDQVAMQVAYPRTNVKIVGFMPGLTTPLGVSHQAIDDVALMRALPGMTIIEPSGPEQIGAAVRAAAARDGPVYLRLPIASRQIDEVTPLRGLTIGKGEILRQGKDIAIITAGVTVTSALRAAELLYPDLDATVVNMHTLKPIDSMLVKQLAASHRALLTLENHSTIGGLGSAVAEVLALSDHNPRFAMIGVPDTFAEGGSLPYLMARFGLDPDSVVITARALVI
jgi:transketolase